MASPGVRLGGQHPHWANTANDRGVVVDQPLGHMTVRLARSPEKQAAFDALLEAQQTLGSPLYHQWLTPAQIGERFGASDTDITAVTSWLRAQGFTVLRVSNSKRFIEIAGTTTIAAKAFAVEFHNYAVGSTTRRSIDREPTIPAPLASVIRSVSGLAEHEAKPEWTSYGPMIGRKVAVADGAGNHYVGAADFATIYNLGPAHTAGLTGTGQVIGIIGRANVLPADVTNYGARMGVTMPTVVKVVPSTGVDPGAPCGDPSCTNDDQLEATLDVERAGSIAYGAKIEMIASASTDDDGTDIAFQFAIDNFGTASDANILNVSFGQCEDDVGEAQVESQDTISQQAAMEGISVFVSSGDAGAAGCYQSGSAPPDGQTLGVNYLGISGSVTCVGGTEFADAASPTQYWDGSGAALSYIPEGAWNDGNFDNMFLAEGTGGGQSEFIAKPTFQNGLGPANSTNRLVPDMSFTAAAGNDPYVLCIAEIMDSDCSLQGSGGFSFFPVGGTSASAPDTAGVMALIDESVGANQGNANPTLYMLAADTSNKVFHDVTVASSGVADCSESTSMCNNSDPGPSSLTTGALAGFEVGTGYDQATGLGSVDISELISHWPGASLAMLSIDPTSLSVFAGKSGTVALTPSGFTGAPTFSCSHGLPSNATCTFAGNTLTVTIAAGAAGVTDEGSRGRWVLLPLGLALLALLRSRPRRRFAAIFTVFAMTALSCGSSSNGQTDAPPVVDAAPPVTNAVTITASAGSASASAMLSLTSN